MAASDVKAEETGAARRVLLRAGGALIGILLSGWIVQAFARQWDDRQKAHALKASVIEEMAVADARALAAGQRFLFERRPKRYYEPGHPTPAALNRYALDSIQIDAKLRAYFSSQIETNWRYHSAQVQHVLEVITRSVGPVPLVRFGPGPDIRRYMEVHSLGDLTVAPAMRVYDQRREKGLSLAHAGVHLKRGYSHVELRILDEEADIAKAVLLGHATGYSTSAGDLLHDLKP